MMYLVSCRFGENVKMEKLSILIPLFLIKLSNAKKEKHLVHSQEEREGSITVQTLIHGMEANGTALEVPHILPLSSPFLPLCLPQWGGMPWAVGCRLCAVSLYQHVER